MPQKSADPAREEPFTPADQSLTDTTLVKIREGMKVYDRDDKEVGKVGAVYLGEVNAQMNERGEGAATARDPSTSGPGGAPLPPVVPTSQSYIGTTIPPASDLDIDGLPDVVRNRLARLGFIRIGGGIFGGARFALPEQIANVQDDRVNLNVTNDELIKR